MVREVIIRCEYCDEPGEECQISLPEGRGVADLCVKHRKPLIEILKVSRTPTVTAKSPAGRMMESRIRGV